MVNGHINWTWSAFFASFRYTAGTLELFSCPVCVLYFACGRAAYKAFGYFDTAMGGWIHARYGVAIWVFFDNDVGGW